VARQALKRPDRGVAQGAGLAIKHVGHGTVREQGGRLISLWATEVATGVFVASAAYAVEDGLLWVQLPVPREHEGEVGYPDVSAIFPCVSRMQRAVWDLLGLRDRRRRYAAVAESWQLASRLLSAPETVIRR
jgi:hypothetical protein